MPTGGVGHCREDRCISVVEASKSYRRRDAIVPRLCGDAYPRQRALCSPPWELLWSGWKPGRGGGESSGIGRGRILVLANRTPLPWSAGLESVSDHPRGSGRVPAGNGLTKQGLKLEFRLCPIIVKNTAVLRIFLPTSRYAKLNYTCNIAMISSMGHFSCLKHR